jgi:hypothetical protein
MARLIFIGGDSGSGKSSSLATLNPETTVIINTDKKDLPFKGWQNLYSEEKKNYREITEHSELLDTLAYANKNPKIQVCVLDTWNREMIDYTFSKKFRAVADGRKAWMTFGLEQYEFLHSIPRAYRPDLNVYLLCHIETIKSEAGILMQRIAAPGNMITDLKPESFSTVVFYTEIQAVPGKRPEYYFRTVSSGVDTCKTPMGMFEEIRIPNNLGEIDKRIREYYS